MKRPEIVNKIKEVIRKADPTATAILYGSEARGDARPDSDFDVLILLEGEKRNLKREDEMSGALYDLELSTGALISPMIMLRRQWENRPIKTPFYINVMNEGIRLWINGISSPGVKTMLGLHFVSKGILSIEYGKTFSRLFEIRHSSDYDDFVYCDKELYDEYAPKAQKFVEAVKELIGK